MKCQFCAIAGWSLKKRPFTSNQYRKRENIVFIGEKKCDTPPPPLQIFFSQRQMFDLMTSSVSEYCAKESSSCSMFWALCDQIKMQLYQISVGKVIHFPEQRSRMGISCLTCGADLRRSRLPCHTMQVKKFGNSLNTYF